MIDEAKRDVRRECALQRSDRGATPGVLERDTALALSVRAVRLAGASSARVDGRQPC
jgi:hypothetical protein